MNSGLYLQPVEKGTLLWAGYLYHVKEHEDKAKIYTENIRINVSSQAGLQTSQ